MCCSEENRLSVNLNFVMYNVVLCEERSLVSGHLFMYTSNNSNMNTKCHKMSYSPSISSYLYFAMVLGNGFHNFYG